MEFYLVVINVVENVMNENDIPVHQRRWYIYYFLLLLFFNFCFSYLGSLKNEPFMNIFLLAEYLQVIPSLH